MSVQHSLASSVLLTSSSVDQHRSANRPDGSLLVEILLSIFEAVNCGAVTLDANKRVLSFNVRAKKCFGDGILLSKARLCATEHACDVLLQTALDQALKYRDHSRVGPFRQAVGLSRSEHTCIIARVIPIKSETQQALGGAAVLVLIIDPEDCAEPSHTILEQVFGLTRSESRVATRLLCGQTVQEVADETGVTPGTVRTQIKSVFSKTNTHRQAQLVGLLTRLAMVSQDERASESGSEPESPRKC